MQASGAVPGAPFEKLAVRAAAAADLPAITALDEAVTGEPKPDYWRKLIARAAQGGPDDPIFLVAEAGPRLIGFIAGDVRAFEFGAGASGWVFALNVDPGQRDMDAGTHLFEGLCRRFRAAGVTKVRTLTERNNGLVLAFFRGLGLMAGPFIQLEKDLD
jgi:ribosomal protein S18 acetylase RimI-like enzyme